MTDTVMLEVSQEELELLRAVRRLSPERRRHLLEQLGSESSTKMKLVTIPAEQLEPLIGIISVGGDALEDSERLYDE